MASVRLERDVIVEGAGICRFMPDARAGTRHHPQVPTVVVARTSDLPEIAGVRLKHDLTAGAGEGAAVVVDARAGARHHPQAKIATFVCPERSGVRLERDLTPV